MGSLKVMPRTPKGAFSWWNTGLSPRRRKRFSQSDFDIAIEVIRDLFLNSKVDLLALGEITDDDLKEISVQLKIKNIKPHFANIKVKYSYFDLGILYNSDLISITFLTILNPFLVEIQPRLHYFMRYDI